MGYQTNVGYQCHTVILHRYSTCCKSLLVQTCKKHHLVQKQHHLVCVCGQPCLDVAGYQQESVVIMKCGVLSLQHLRKYDAARTDQSE